MKRRSPSDESTKFFHPVQDRDLLVDALRQQGIRFLAGGSGETPKEDLGWDRLIASLCLHKDPRLRRLIRVHL